MSNNLTVFIITGNADSVMGSVKDLVTSGMNTKSFKATPNLLTVSPVVAKLSPRKTACKLIPMPLIYRSPASAYLSANNTVRFSDFRKFLIKTTGSAPTNRELSSFLRSNDYQRYHELSNNKNTYFWKKDL